MTKIRAYFTDSPVRTRALVVAALALLAQYVPAVADFAAEEAVIGALVALVALALGESAQRKEDAKTEDARAELPLEH